MDQHRRTRCSYGCWRWSFGRVIAEVEKNKTCFISHPDRDHLTGIPQFIQLNAREGFPKVYYPKDSGSFPALNEFLDRFDPHVQTTQWFGVEDGSAIEIRNNLFVQAFRNEHINSAVGVHKSLSYRIVERKRKLKTEFIHLNSNDIKAIVKQYGRAYLTNRVDRTLISYSGDTPVDDYSKWDGSDILIHECTFLQQEGDEQIENRGNKHSQLEEVIKMASEIDINILILSHFSSRYSEEIIRATVKKSCVHHGIKIPVFAFFPGQVHRDILNSKPIF